MMRFSMAAQPEPFSWLVTLDTIPENSFSISFKLSGRVIVLHRAGTCICGDCERCSRATNAHPAVIIIARHQYALNEGNLLKLNDFLRAVAGETIDTLEIELLIDTWVEQFSTLASGALALDYAMPFHRASTGVTLRTETVDVTPENYWRTLTNELRELASHCLTAGGEG